jgi:hypothetical protein
MTILHPKALIWASLAVPVVLLYLWRTPPRRRLVATGFLWERVLGASGRRATWWSYRHPISLGVQLVFLAIVVLALAEPRFRLPARLVLVIDNSASMNATDVEPTRLDRAKELARAHLAALGDRDQMAIITAGDTVRVRCGLTGRRNALEQALAGVVPTREGTRVTDAVALARRLLEGEPNGRIVVLTDGCFDGAPELARQDDVELVALGGRGDNVAITRLAARRSRADPLSCQVFVEVTSYTDEPVACRIELERQTAAQGAGTDSSADESAMRATGRPAEGDPRPLVSVPIELAAGGRWQHVFETAADEGDHVVARLDRPDVLLEDNQARARVPPCSTHEVAPATDGNADLEESLRVSPAVKPAVTGSLPQGRGESDVRVSAGLASRAEMPAPRAPGPPVWLMLAAAAMLLAVTEWYSFQRRWTC